MGLILQYRRRAQSRFSLSKEVEQFAYKNMPAKNIYRIEMKDTQPGDDSLTGIGVYEYFNRNKDIDNELVSLIKEREPRQHMGLTNISWKGTLPCLSKAIRPGLYEDPELRYIYKYFLHNGIGDKGHLMFRFGFSSMEQLNKWFYDKRELELMHEAGFVISVYRCKKYLIGSHQAIFLPKNSVKSYEISII